MPAFLRLLLILTLAIPAALPARASVPADCIVCGHVCCCPEMCAPEIARRQSLKTGCDNAAADCRLSAPKPAPAAFDGTSDPAAVAIPRWLASVRPANPRGHSPLWSLGIIVLPGPDLAPPSRPPEALPQV